MVTTEVTTLHHEQFVDGVVNRSMQTLRQRRRLVGRWTMMGMVASLVTTFLATATLVFTYVETSLRSVQRQVTAAETFARMARICI